MASNLINIARPVPTEKVIDHVKQLTIDMKLPEVALKPIVDLISRLFSHEGVAAVRNTVTHYRRSSMIAKPNAPPEVANLIVAMANFAHFEYGSLELEKMERETYAAQIANSIKFQFKDDTFADEFGELLSSQLEERGYKDTNVFTYPGEGLISIAALGNTNTNASYEFYDQVRSYYKCAVRRGEFFYVLRQNLGGIAWVMLIDWVREGNIHRFPPSVIDSILKAIIREYPLIKTIFMEASNNIYKPIRNEKDLQHTFLMEIGEKNTCESMEKAFSAV